MASKRKDNNASNPLPKRPKHNILTGSNTAVRSERPPDGKKYASKHPKRKKDNRPKEHEEDDTTPATKREYTETDQKLGKLYAQLADNSTDLRVEAAKQLLLECDKIKTNREDILKAFKRLFRGVCSGRDSARSGFFMTLTELIRVIFKDESPVVEAGELVKMAEETTHVGGSASGQERRDHEYGRLYAYNALVDSGVLNNTPAWTQALDVIVSQSRSTAWIREECAIVLCNIVLQLEQNQAGLLAHCLNSLKEKGLTKTPEGVMIWLTVQASFPEFNSYPENVWIQNDPLLLENASDLEAAMKDQYNSNPANGVQGVSQGIWKQKLHAAWTHLFKYIATLAENPTRQSFQNVWNALVDNGLFNQAVSEERKSWGFQLFSQLVQTLPSGFFAQMWSPNFREYLIDQVRYKKRLLHKAGLEVLNKVQLRGSERRKDIPALISAIAKGSTEFILFDGHSRTISGLVSLADEKGYQKILKVFSARIFKPCPGENDAKLVTDIRTAISEILRHSLTNKPVEDFQGEDEDSWISDLLTLFAKIGYCVLKPNETHKEKNQPVPDFTDQHRSLFQSKLFSCLTYMIAKKPSNPGFWAWFVIQKIHNLTKDSKPYTLALQADDAVTKSLKKAYKVVQRIQKEESKAENRSIRDALSLLFCLTLLQAYGGDADSVAMLDDLVSCHDAILQKDTSSSAFELLVEVLLSFIAKPSTLFRTMVEQVFETISPSINENGLDSLVAILAQSESLAGQQELFDEDVSVESEDDEDDEDASDVEMIEANGTGDPDEAEPFEEASDVEDEDDEELKRFDELLAKALEIKDPDEKSDDDEEPMDDEQMMALEPQIAKIFHERRLQTSRRKENQNARENVINFKRRVLDLLAIYLKSQHHSPLALTLVAPLLRLIRTTREKTLQTKAADILGAYYAAHKKKKQSEAAEAISMEMEEAAWKALEAVHVEVLQSRAQFHGMNCSKASLFAARIVAHKRTSESCSRIADVYHGTMQRWIKDRSSGTQVTFFTEWMSFLNEMRKTMKSG